MQLVSMPKPINPTVVKKSSKPINEAVQASPEQVQAAKAACIAAENLEQKEIRRELFDPTYHYNGSDRAWGKLDPAWGQASLFFRSAPNPGGHETPHMSSALGALQLLKEYESRYKAGDNVALLNAVDACANRNLPLPNWLKTAFRERLASFISTTGTSHSLDEAFSSPDFPTTTKQSAGSKQDLKVGWSIYLKAAEIYADETLTSVDSLVKRVLKENSFGVELTKAKKLLSLVEKNELSLRNKESQTFSQFYANRRKGLKQK